MAIHATISGAMSEIEFRVDQFLEGKCAEIVKEQISESMESVVYGAGQPRRYHRRGTSTGSGGLGDVSTMHHSVSNNTLFVSADAKAQGNGFENTFTLAENIEYGWGRKDQGEWYNQPRPFIEDAVEQLKSNKKIEKALKEEFGGNATMGSIEKIT